MVHWICFHYREVFSRCDAFDIYCSFNSTLTLRFKTPNHSTLSCCLGSTIRFEVNMAEKSMIDVVQNLSKQDLHAEAYGFINILSS